MMIKCRRCGQEKTPHKTNRHLCEDCVKAENNRVSYYRYHNFNWIDIAREAELELWERQPAETDREWQIWLAYRDMYPSTRPSYRQVAEQLGTTVAVVKKIGARWDFPVRLQAWAKYVDNLTLQQRQQEILDMNKRHIEMATALNEKLATAINAIDPYELEPKDIKGLLQLSAELERKARLHNSDVIRPELADENPNLKESPTKTEDLKEVLDILVKANVFKAIGVKKTTTTEVVVKE
jgi:cysteinyl-tRNA synthetase